MPVMAAILKWDQVGLPAGTPGNSRDDGLDNGAVITMSSTGAGAVHALELLWVPDDDVSAEASFASASPTSWTMTPQAGRYGTYIARLTVDGEVTEHSFSILTPNFQLRIPGLNERASRIANLASAASPATKVALLKASTHNTPDAGNPAFALGDYGGWYSAIRKLILAVDLLGAPTETTFTGGMAEFYVSTTGDDAAAGTIGAPWLTYARFAQEVMQYERLAADTALICHLMGNGVQYDAAPIHGVELDTGAHIAIIGDEVATIAAALVMGPGTNSADAVVGGDEAVITVTGAAFTVDEFQGMTCHVKTGACAGARITIASNSPTILRLADNSFTLTAGFVFSDGDTFDIEQPAVLLVDSGFAHLNARGTEWGRVVLVNLMLDGTDGVATYAYDTTVYLLGCEILAEAFSSGDDARLYVGLARWGDDYTPPNNAFWELIGGPPTVGENLSWYSWGGRVVGSLGVVSAYSGGWTLVNGAVVYKAASDGDDALVSLFGILLTGSATAFGKGLIRVIGFGAPARIEGVPGPYGGCLEASEGGELKINRATFATVGRCIQLINDGKALLGTADNESITGGTGMGSAVGVIGCSTLLLRSALTLTPDDAPTWVMDVISGGPLDISYDGGAVMDTFGNKIRRLTTGGGPA